MKSWQRLLVLKNHTVRLQLQRIDHSYHLYK